jgi:hypothetical protein
MRVGPQHGKLAMKCPPRQEGGCNGRVIELAPLRDFIDRYMVRRMSDPQTLRELSQREAEHDTAAEALLESIERDERRAKALRANLSDSGESVDDLTEAIRIVRQRLAQSRRELAEASQTPELARLDLPELARRWKSLHIDTKRTLLRLFVKSITIGPGQPGRRTFDFDRVDIIPA